MSLLRKETNKYPTIFSYSDEWSIGSLSERDLETSYAFRVAGKESSRKPALNERVLVIAKKKNGVHVFPAQVTGEVTKDDPRRDTWYDRGGNKWKYNYSIEPLGETTYLSNEEVIEITGCPENKNRRIWVDIWANEETGQWRQSILDYLLQ